MPKHSSTRKPPRRGPFQPSNKHPCQDCKKQRSGCAVILYCDGCGIKNCNFGKLFTHSVKAYEQSKALKGCPAEKLFDELFDLIEDNKGLFPPEFLARKLTIADTGRLFEPCESCRISNRTCRPMLTCKRCENVKTISECKADEGLRGFINNLVQRSTYAAATSIPTNVDEQTEQHAPPTVSQASSLAAPDGQQVVEYCVDDHIRIDHCPSTPVAKTDREHHDDELPILGQGYQPPLTISTPAAADGGASPILPATTPTEGVFQPGHGLLSPWNNLGIGRSDNFARRATSPAFSYLNTCAYTPPANWTLVSYPTPRDTASPVTPQTMSFGNASGHYLQDSSNIGTYGTISHSDTPWHPGYGCDTRIGFDCLSRATGFPNSDTNSSPFVTNANPSNLILTSDRNASPSTLTLPSALDTMVHGAQNATGPYGCDNIYFGSTPTNPTNYHDYKLLGTSAGLPHLMIRGSSGNDRNTFFTPYTPTSPHPAFANKTDAEMERVKGLPCGTSQVK